MQVEVCGMPQDNAYQRTKTHSNTGRLHVNQTYTFQITYPELAFLVIKAMVRVACMYVCACGVRWWVWVVGMCGFLRVSLATGLLCVQRASCVCDGLPVWGGGICD